MPAVWRNVGHTLTAGVFAAAMLATNAAYSDGFSPETFEMIFDSSADAIGPNPYNPIESPVEAGFMPFDVLGLSHPFANFFGAGTNLPAAYTPLGGSKHNFKGHMTGAEGGFNIWWDVDIDVDPVVNVNLLINNNTGSDQTFTLTVPLITGPVGPSTILDGAISGTAADGIDFGGGTVQAIGVPGYQAFIDGALVQSLIPPGTQFNYDPFSTGTVGPDGFGPTAGPAVVNDIALTLTFTISAWDSAIINGTFEVQPIPAPGAIALLGVAGLVGRRRRRA